MTLESCNCPPPPPPPHKGPGGWARARARVAYGEWRVLKHPRPLVAAVVTYSYRSKTLKLILGL